MSSDLVDEIENAIDRGNAAALGKLMEDAPDDLKGALDRTPLHYAADKGRDKLVVLLIERECDLNAREYQNATALQLAASRAHAKTCKALLDAGAATDLANSFGELPIHSAARGTGKFKTRTTIVRDMIAAGSPLTQLNNAAQSPLQVAAMLGNKDLVVLLLGALKDVGASDPKDLDAAIQKARAKGFSKIVALIEESL